MEGLRQLLDSKNDVSMPETAATGFSPIPSSLDLTVPMSPVHTVGYYQPQKHKSLMLTSMTDMTCNGPDQDTNPVRRSRSTSNVLSENTKQEKEFPVHTVVRTPTPSFTHKLTMPPESGPDTSSSITAPSSPTSSSLSAHKMQFPSHASSDVFRNILSIEDFNSPEHSTNNTAPTRRVRTRARKTSISLQTSPPASELTLPTPAKRKRVDREPDLNPIPKNIESKRSGPMEANSTAHDGGSNLGSISNVG
jgi:hypothetical protein